MSTPLIAALLSAAAGVLFTGACLDRAGSNASRQPVSAPPPMADEALVDATVTVGTQDLGPMPQSLRAGVFTFAAVPPGYPVRLLTTELKPGAVETSLGHFVLRHAQNPDDAVRLVARLDEFLIEVDRSGGVLTFGFSKIPRWLSSRPNDFSPAMEDDTTPVAEVSPPRDYEEWAGLVERVVGHIKSLGIDARYKIGWEPNTPIWAGTDREFFEYYKYAVLGARRADPGAKVGGPGVTDLPPLKPFIQYCAQTPLPELGYDRLPIDFVAIHRFGAHPHTTYDLIVNKSRLWLEQNGYNANATEVYVAEWSDPPAFLDPAHDGPYTASYVVASMVAMDSAGVDLHSFTSLLDQERSESTEFNGSFGALTKSFVKKASYNALHAMSMLGERRINVTTDDDWVFAAAGRDGPDRVTVVMTNYLPRPDIMRRGAIEWLLLNGHTYAELGALGGEREVMDLISGRADPQGSSASPELKRSLVQLRREMREQSSTVNSRAKRPTNVQLRLEDLGWTGPARVTEYRVGAQHANAQANAAAIDQIVNAERQAIQQRVLQDMSRRLLAAGLSEDEVRMWDRFADASDKRRLREQLTGEQRQTLIRTVDRAMQILDEELTPAVERINSRDDVRLAPIRSGNVQIEPGKAFPVRMLPHEVVVLVFEKP
ncbi:MAG: hypothetical protein AAF995_07155 [Planctomycetota bacterium]